MSIVEKAISKLQASRAKAATAVPPTPLAAAAQTAAAARPLPARPVREPRVAVPRESVKLDLARLRTRGLLPLEHASARVIDECRRIKWQLLANAFGRDTPRVERGNLIMVASCVPNEGKTFISTTLAMTIALDHEQAVLLIDADAAKPNISEDFGAESKRGLIDALASDSIDPEELILDTSVAGLSFLPAGQRNSRTAELFASQRMDEMAASLAGRDPNRIIIVDSSPLMATNEAQVLARVVGQILVVVRANHTLQPVVREALALLDPAKSISFMLNQTDAGFGEYYGGYYGYEKNE